MRLRLKLDLYVYLSPLNGNYVPSSSEMLEDLNTWLQLKHSDVIGCNATRIELSEETTSPTGEYE